MSFIQIALDALSLGGFYAICALGIGFIFGILKIVNMAHGELIMVAGYALVGLGARSLPVMIGGTLLAVLVAAVTMERLAIRPMRKGTTVTLLVSTLTLSVFLQNVPLLFLGDTAQARAIEVPAWVNEQLEWGELRIPNLQLLTLGATVLLVSGLVGFLRYTPLGLQLRAVAEDFGMARLLGIRVSALSMTAFAISGVLAMITALLYFAQTGFVTPDCGAPPVLFGLVATVVGGMESLLGTILAAFLLGITSIIFQAYLPSSLAVFRDAFVFGMVILILLLRPRGLIPARMARERL
ncbi:MAG: branched-chain amino acid ABC transporter permease [Myxococcaceae bacterium]